MDELFSYRDFKIIFDAILKIKMDIRIRKEVKYDLLMSVLAEDRNLDEFEIHFLDFLEKDIEEFENELYRIYEHIKTEKKSN